jgi:cytochrome P450
MGRSSFQLHNDPIVFPDPKGFIPDRWFEEDPEVKESTSKHWFTFGAGSRACIAGNLAMTDLYMSTEKVIESRVLEGAKACEEKTEIYEWFNSSVKGEKVELVWPAS